MLENLIVRIFSKRSPSRPRITIIAPSTSEIYLYVQYVHTLRNTRYTQNYFQIHSETFPDITRKYFARKPRNISRHSQKYFQTHSEIFPDTLRNIPTDTQKYFQKYF